MNVEVLQPLLKDSTSDPSFCVVPIVEFELLPELALETAFFSLSLKMIVFYVPSAYAVKTSESLPEKKEATIVGMKNSWI